MFASRTEAGQKLAQRLTKFSHIENGIVLALPRGGVIVGKEIAEKLNLPLDIIVTRKIGAPQNSEYAVAAVSEHELIISPRENPRKNYLELEAQKERREIQRRVSLYRKGKSKLNLKDKIVFLVDDGLATGLTMEAAIREVQFYRPRKVILAVPVAPPETIAHLKTLVGECIVLNIEPMFFAVGQFYENFPQISDKEVLNLLK